MAVTGYFVEVRKEGRRAEAAACCPPSQVTTEGRAAGGGTKQALQRLTDAGLCEGWTMQAVLPANGTFQHPWKAENLKN